MTNRVSIDRLHQLLSYEPETGAFRWKAPAGRHGRYPAGSIAGGLNKERYRYINLDGQLHFAPHLAWAMTHGVWPDAQIDHKNGNTSDDRIENLRLATPSQNKTNCGLYSNNTSGFKCVYYCSDRNCWRAKVVIEGKRKWLRRWPTPEEAYAEFCQVSAKEYGEFARPERKGNAQ